MWKFSKLIKKPQNCQKSQKSQKIKIPKSRKKGQKTLKNGKNVEILKIVKNLKNGNFKKVKNSSKIGHFYKSPLFSLLFIRIPEIILGNKPRCTFLVILRKIYQGNIIHFCQKPTFSKFHKNTLKSGLPTISLLLTFQLQTCLWRG